MQIRLASLCLAICVAVSAPANAETGKVILALGAGPNTRYMQYQLQLRSLDRKHSETATYYQHNWMFNHRDFDDADENGTVEILTLEAGTWEICGIDLHTTVGDELEPSRGFSIPFTVKPGETVYIGDFKARGLFKPFQDTNIPMAAGVIYTVRDASTRDIAIARTRDKTIGEVTVALPDVKAAGSQYFATPLDGPTTGSGDATAPGPPRARCCERERCLRATHWRNARRCNCLC